MFERFTDRARRVVVLAQEEARMLSHNYIGTEHILLGLIHEGEGVAAKALEFLDISLEAVRAQVEEIIGQGQQGAVRPGSPSPRAPRRCSSCPCAEAVQVGHSYIGTEHILLGLYPRGRGCRCRGAGGAGRRPEPGPPAGDRAAPGFQGKESTASAAARPRAATRRRRRWCSTSSAGT